MLKPEWYKEEWEQRVELAGPICETCYPDTHRCEPNPSFVCPDESCPVERGGAWRIWPIIAPILEGKERVIDIGCGLDGRSVLPGALGWDIAADPAQDARDLTAAGGPFDLVYSSHLIEHIPSREVPMMLAEWARVLEPEGELFATAPHRCSGEWSPLLNSGVAEQHLWAPTAACIGNLLALLGMDMFGYEDHCCTINAFWVHARRPA